MIKINAYLNALTTPCPISSCITVVGRAVPTNCDNVSLNRKMNIIIIPYIAFYLW